MRKPQSGDVYDFIVPVKAGSGKIYQIGNYLTLLEPTGLDPFGQGEKVGDQNWLVACKYFKPPDKESVWATIEHMLDRGLIRLVE